MRNEWANECRQIVESAEACAWRELSSYHSVISGPDDKINVEILLDKIANLKKQIEKLVDSF